jgi:hypothetical protein
MAELYLAQGFRDRALNVYRQLAALRPGDERLRAKLAELEAPAAEHIPARTRPRSRSRRFLTKRGTRKRQRWNCLR